MNDKKEITIDGKHYMLDIEQAKAKGVITTKLPDNIDAGDVFVDPKGRFNRLRLIKAVYGSYDYKTDRAWNLLGVSGGCSPNSDQFFNELHTIGEIRNYLTMIGYEYSHGTSDGRSPFIK